MMSQLRTLTVVLIHAASLAFVFPVHGQQSGTANTVFIGKEGPFKRRIYGADSVEKIGGKTVVFSEGAYFELNIEKATLLPLQIQGLEFVLDIAESPTLGTVALGNVGRLKQLILLKGENIRKQEIPKEMSVSPLSKRILASGDQIIITQLTRAASLENGNWCEFEIPDPSDKELRDLLRIFHTPELKDQFLFDGAIYNCYNEGEWGGGLLRFDLAKKKWDAVDPRNVLTDPITDFLLMPNETLWITQGLSHLSMMEGKLIVASKEKWEVVVKITGVPEFRADKNWNLGPTDILGVDIGDKGRIHLLTGRYGVVVQNEDNNWTQLTENWNRYVYATDFCLADEYTIVISTYDAGVIIWNCKDQTWKIASFSKVMQNSKSTK